MRRHLWYTIDPGAIASMAVALRDLKARLLGLPLVALIGAVRSQVPVYASGGFISFDDPQLVQGWSRGWRRGSRG